MKIAIFGGTFDPIHKAHLAMAREAADRFRLDRVLFIPAGRPPHKQAGARAPYEDRVRIAELGERAMKRLLDLVEGDGDESGPELHSPELVVRTTTLSK